MYNTLVHVPNTRSTLNLLLSTFLKSCILYSIECMKTKNMSHGHGPTILPNNMYCNLICSKSSCCSCMYTVGIFKSQLLPHLMFLHIYIIQYIYIVSACLNKFCRHFCYLMSDSILYKMSPMTEPSINIDFHLCVG